MKVIVSVFSNLLTDQRVEKVCNTLFHAGYTIELIGNDWGGLPDMNRPYAIKRIHLQSKSLKFAYPEFNYKLYQEIKKRADQNTILLANDLDSLLPNFLISKKLKIPLVYDSHEIFTEMPSVNGRFSQKVWRLLERNMVPKIEYMMVANGSYGDWYSNRYGIPKPITIRNFPIKYKITETGLKKTLKPQIIMYQGAINPYRGIDKIISSMHLIDDVHLWIVGNGPKKKQYQELTQSLGLEDRVKFFGSVSPQKLREITPNADLGISIEENQGLSYYLSLPNKISDYIQARIPVVASDFPEMSHIIKTYGVGDVIANHTPEELAHTIKKVLANGKDYYKSQLDLAAESLCWDNEAPKILRLFEKIKKNFL